MIKYIFFPLDIVLPSEWEWFDWSEMNVMTGSHGIAGDLQSSFSV